MKFYVYKCCLFTWLTTSSDFICSQFSISTAGRLQLTLLLLDALSHLSLRFQLRFFAVHHCLHSTWETTHFLYITWALANVHLPRTSMYIRTTPHCKFISEKKRLVQFPAISHKLDDMHGKDISKIQLHLHNQPPKASKSIISPPPASHVSPLEIVLVQHIQKPTLRGTLRVLPSESISKDQQNQYTSSDRNQALLSCVKVRIGELG